MTIILGLESSCDETAAALVTADGRILAHRVAGQEAENRPYGGVVPEIAARAQAARREADRLDRTRSELLVEASRREAERARREAERLRVQAQIQAEEADRLRLAAEAEALARQEAETTLDTVAGQQASRLSAARQRELKLARE